MRRYSIMVLEHGSGLEVELCQVDNNPKAIAAAAGRKGRVARVRIVDHEGPLGAALDIIAGAGR
jgi:hypothetical protein